MLRPTGKAGQFICIAQFISATRSALENENKRRNHDILQQSQGPRTKKYIKEDNKRLKMITISHIGLGHRLKKALAKRNVLKTSLKNCKLLANLIYTRSLFQARVAPKQKG